jgi:Flp pilus assembly protein protease CpaA
MQQPLFHSGAPDETTAPAGGARTNWPILWATVVLLAATATLLAQFLQETPAGGLLIPVFTLLVCLVASVFDAATSRIPNPLTYPAILVGLALGALPPVIARAGGPDLSHWLGSPGPSQSLLGFAGCLGIGIVCLLAAGLGGGDLKLLVAVGALLGLSEALHVFLWTLLIAVPYALINLSVRGRLNGVLGAAALQLLQVIYWRRIEPASVPSSSAIPLAVPMAAGLVCARLVPRDALTGWMGG